MPANARRIPGPTEKIFFEQAGQTIIEYGMLAAILAACIIAFAPGLSGAIGTMYNRLFAAL